MGDKSQSDMWSGKLSFVCVLYKFELLRKPIP